MERLLERDGEFAAIAGRLDRLQAGNGGVVMLAGESGIGKTSLLIDTGGRAERAGVRVLRASGLVLEREFGFGLVRQLLERVVRKLTQAERDQVFAGPGAPAAGVFGLPDPQQAQVPGADPAFLVRHALYWVLDELARHRPLALLIDDLQWVDGASPRWLAYLARRVEAMPVLLVAALRTGEESAAPEAIAELESVAARDLLRPGRLSAGAVAELAAREFGAGNQEFAPRCHQATAGNPLLVRELLRAASEEGLVPSVESLARFEVLAAQRLGDRIVRRLGRCSVNARDLAAAVAVVGVGELRVAAGLAGLTIDMAGAAADELCAAGILDTERPVRFVHPLLGSAVAADLPPAARASAHRRAAVLLDTDPERGDEAAVHLLRAEPAGDPWVVDRLRRAAARALARGAPDAGVTLLNRALAEPAGTTRGEVLFELGRAERRAGRAAEAVEHLAASRDLVSPVGREAVAHELAWALWLHNRFEEGASVLEAAIADLEGPDEEVREARLRLEAAFATMALGSDEAPRRGLERIDRAARDLQGATPAGRAVLVCAAYAHYWSGSVDAETFMAEVEQLLAVKALQDDVIAGCTTRVLLLVAICFAEHAELALVLLDELIAGERKRGDLALLPAYLNVQARILAFLGRLEEAEATAREAFELLAAEQHYGRPALVAALITPMIATGRVEEADAALEQLGPTGPIGPVGTFHAARMELRTAQGRHSEAVADAAELVGRLHARGHVGIRLLDVAAATFLAAGDATRAIEVAEEGLAAARRWGAPGAIAPNLRVLGQATGDEAALRESVALLEGGPFRLDLAKGLLALGSHLRRGRARAEARVPLRRALDLAYRCGAVPLAQRADVELRACGARPRSVMLSGVESLTPSERRLAELVAGGKSNAEVARALFVTRSTVEAHLRSIFRKLGVSSRHAIAPLLQGETSFSLNDASEAAVQRPSSHELDHHRPID